MRGRPALRNLSLWCTDMGCHKSRRSTAIDTSLLRSVSITVISRAKFDTDPTWTSSKIYP
jgi:hypothetical protein